MPEIILHILDLMQNSISAGATYIRIRIEVLRGGDTLTVTIEDNGSGMSEEFAKKVTDPFSTTRTTRKVGLGIPFFKAGCEGTGGSFSLSTKLGEGTIVSGTYILSHIDRPPLGDFADTIHIMIISNPDIRFVVECVDDAGEFIADTQQMKEILGGVPLDTPEVSLWLREYLQENCAARDMSV